ncbi:MAG: hypothetical protein JNJ45_08505 [Chthonomonas sp.]|nr:hypothetical protein [Chthonomonas sp.]
MKFLLPALALLLIGCDSGLENKRLDQEGHTVVGQTFARAKDEVCMSNLRSLRQSVELYRSQSEDNANPPVLIGLPGIPESMTSDPIDHKPYEYNPATGEVKCNHPGHSKY